MVMVPEIRRRSSKHALQLPCGVVLMVIILFSGSTVLHAQDTDAGQVQRQGFWIGVGAGAAHSYIDCSPCGPLFPDDPWDGGMGFGLYLAMGIGVQPDFLVGAEVNLYGRRNSALARDATLGGLSAIAQFYPISRTGFYLKGGAGIGGSIMAGGPGLIESGGWTAQGGGGYDVRIARRLWLAPFANFVQVFSAGDVGDNQGMEARGPRNPYYVQFGLAVHWYR